MQIKWYSTTMVGQGVQPVGQPLTRLCLSKFGIRLIVAGIHGPSGQGTDRSGSVRDFQNFVGPVRDLEIFLGSGSIRSQVKKICLGPSTVWSQVLKFFSVLVRFGPWFRNFSWSWSELVLDFYNFSGPGPGPTGFGLWIPRLEFRFGTIQKYNRNVCCMIRNFMYRSDTQFLN